MNWRLFLTLGLVLCGAVCPALAQSDTEPPELIGFDFSPRTVDTSNSSASITFVLHVTDDIAGVDHIQLGLEGNTCTDYSPNTGTVYDGTWSCTVTLPQYSAAGTWLVNFVRVYDEAGNQRQHQTAALTQLGFPTEVIVTSTTSDTEPPELIGFDFSPRTVDTSNSSASITFVLHVTDDIAGVDHIQLGLEGNTCTDYSPNTGTVYDGTWSCTVTLPQYSAAGTWLVNFVRVYDEAGNQRQHQTAALTQLGFPTEVIVTSTTSDIEPPELIGFDFSPRTVDTSNSSASITFVLHVTDDIAGVDHIQLGLEGNTCTDYSPNTGTVYDGTWSCTVTLPQYSAAGTWLVNFVRVYDEAGNQRQHQTAALTQLGFPTEVIVAPDSDNDGVPDPSDNCPEDPNPAQDDVDSDGFGAVCDCDDLASGVFPGAPELCDGQNNNCTDPRWPLIPPEDLDLDGDLVRVCAGDCDDSINTVYPGAPQICDGLNNDCDHPAFPVPPVDDLDSDGDSFRPCDGDCDDSTSSVYSGAPQVCDGLNNDCDSPDWPAVPVNETNADDDGYRVCDNDCDDTDPNINPGASEECNGVDDNCNSLVDEDGIGEDSDGDGVANLCDNCAQIPNASQVDADQDGVGNSCDNCLVVPNTDQINGDSDPLGDACDNCPSVDNLAQNDADHDSVGDACDNCVEVENTSQTDSDSDVLGDACDNCPLDFNPFQDDLDMDGSGDFCDNCPVLFNPRQSDLDSDYQGDYCDLDDGVIYILFHQPEYVEWQEEEGYTSWNSHRGDVDVLRATGVYTQTPGSNPNADKTCSIGDPWLLEGDPPLGTAAFYLTTGNGIGGESSLGVDSDGFERVNAEPCP